MWHGLATIPDCLRSRALHGKGEERTMSGRVPHDGRRDGRFLGVVLAGGQARRMGGGDKGRLDLGGRSLLGEVIARLAPQCDGLVLNANGDAARFADIGLPVVPDSVPDFPGPLAGILAGMDHAALAGFSHILSAAADTPFLPADLRDRLSRAAGEQARPIAMAAIHEAGRLVPQPVFGLWPVALREDLRAALRGGVFRVTSWAGRHGCALAAFAADPADPFLNVNTPEDLERARAVWRGLSGQEFLPRVSAKRSGQGVSAPLTAEAERRHAERDSGRAMREGQGPGRTFDGGET